MSHTKHEMWKYYNTIKKIFVNIAVQVSIIMCQRQSQYFEKRRPISVHLSVHLRGIFYSLAYALPSEQTSESEPNRHEPAQLLISIEQIQRAAGDGCRSLPLPT
jgi:hypothetical protein